MQKKVTIKNNKPRFLRIHSGVFNFDFDDMKNHVSICKRVSFPPKKGIKLIVLIYGKKLMVLKLLLLLLSLLWSVFKL